MNLVSGHHFSLMPGAHLATGSNSVVENQQRTSQATSATDTPATSGEKPSQQEQRELRLQAQLRTKQAQEQRLIEDQIQTLAARDREVRAHEQAHVAAGGQYAGAPAYQYERGPNGVSYAVGGEVPISTGEEATPEATLRKAQIIRRAALAPAEPSPQDRSVAAMASRLETAARAEIAQARIREEEEPATEAAEKTEDPASGKSLNPTGNDTDTSAADNSQPNNRQQDELTRLQRKLFTRDKMASTPPGTLLSHMA